MSEPAVEPDVTAGDPPVVAPPAPKPQTPQAVPLNAVELGGTGNSDLEDPDD
jgi:hypothetical protein